MKPSEIVFAVTEAVEGGYDARALGYSIFTQGEDWSDLRGYDGKGCRALPLSTIAVCPKQYRLRPVEAMCRGESIGLTSLCR